MIAITSKINSPLAIAADITLLTPNCTEACRLNLAPTSSTLAMLALGDALAMVVSEQKGFCEEDFAELHPGGAIGKRLANVDEVMRALHECRLCHENATIRQMLVGTSLPGRRTGAVMVVNDQQQLVGIFTDSDLTRFLGEHQANDLDTPLRQVMTKAFSAIRSGAKLSDAITILSTRKISELPVVDESDHPLGLVDITDIIGLEGPTVNPESYPLSVFDGNSEGESLGGPHSKGTATDNRSYASPSSLRIFGSGL